MQGIIRVSLQAIASPTISAMAKSQSYLLLGEGDFTYSLDMCRYLASSSSSSSTAAENETPDDDVSITCTGVDTLRELRAKYRDIDFVLRNIRSCSKDWEEGDDDTKSGCGGGGQQRRRTAGRTLSHRHLATTILHGINAIDAKGNNSNDDDVNSCTIRQSFDHVIFNHPHLGTEDTQFALEWII